jgi:hypothetical protein
MSRFLKSGCSVSALSLPVSCSPESNVPPSSSAPAPLQLPGQSLPFHGPKPRRRTSATSKHSDDSGSDEDPDPPQRAASPSKARPAAGGPDSDQGSAASPARGGLLAGYLTEAQLAKALNKDQRTLFRWRQLKIGPPVIMLGEQPLYDIEKARAWMAAGGTAGAPQVQPVRSHKPRATIAGRRT